MRQPRWFAEGFAGYFETVAAKPGEDVTVGNMPDARVQALKRGPLPSRLVLDWQRQATGGNEAALYATSWLLMHYIINQQPTGFANLWRRLARAEDPKAAWRATFPAWDPDVPGATEKLDEQLLAYAQGGTYHYGTLAVEVAPRISARPLSAPEVHTIRLNIPRAWTRESLRAEVNEALAEDPGHVAALLVYSSWYPASAKQLARRAVAAHPEDPRAWGMLANALADDADPRERETCLRRAVELAPDRAAGYVGLASELLAQNRAADALALSGRAVELTPWSAAALQVHAQVLADLGRCDQAIAMSRRAVDLVSDGMTTDQRNRSAEGLGEMRRKCGSVDSRRADDLVRNASRLYRNNDYAGAAKVLNEAVVLDPRHRSAWNDLGRAYHMLGRNDDAVVAFRKQVEIAPEHRFAWNNLGLALQAAGNPKDAEAAFRRQIDIVGDDPSAHIHLGLLLLGVGRSREALPELERAVELTPQNTSALLGVAKAQFAMGDPEKGLATIERTFQIAPGPATRNNAAYTLAEANAYLDRASAWAESAVAGHGAKLRAVTPDAAGADEVASTRALAGAWDTLGWIRFRQGRLLDAERYVVASEQLAPSSVTSDHLGQILERAGRKEEAAHAYARALARRNPPTGARGRLAALVGERRVEEFVAEARTENARLRTVRIRPSTGQEAPDTEILIVLNREGTIADVHPKEAAALPPGATALRGLRAGERFPEDGPNLLVVAARYVCSLFDCGAKIGETDPAATTPVREPGRSAPSVP